MFLNGKSIDDITALTTLKAFYRVDGDVHHIRDAQSGNGITYSGYLVAVGDNNPYGIMGAETVFLYLVDTLYQRGDDVSFGLIHLVGG
jgi:hypothetical protein